jgi:chemotaxis protein MotB
MKRYRPSASPHLLRASGDRWLFGYADIVTLLLACFVCLYAATQAPATEARASLEAPEAAPPPAAALSAPVESPSPTPTSEPVGAVDSTSAAAVPFSAARASSLEHDLRELLGTTHTPLDVELSASDRALVISVPEAGSFPPGQAELSPAARVIMLGLAGELRDRTNQIRIEGHTDDVPIKTARFGSNWELSTARATRVVQFFIEEAGLSAGRLSAAGYAEYRPKVDNDTPANRARNRRVDIVVLQAEPSGLERGLASALGLR